MHSGPSWRVEALWTWVWQEKVTGLQHLVMAASPPAGAAAGAATNPGAGASHSGTTNRSPYDQRRGDCAARLGGGASVKGCLVIVYPSEWLPV